MRRDRVSVPADSAPLGFLPQPAHLGFPVRDGELGGQVAVLEHLGVGLGASGDRQRVPAPLGPHIRAVEGAHLVSGSQVVALAGEPEPVRVVHLRVRPDAQKRVLGGFLVGGDEMGVVGDQRRDAELAGDGEQVVPDSPLDRDATVLHQFQEVAVLPEDVLVLAGGLERVLVLAQPQPGLDRPGRAAGGGDNPVVVAFEQVVIHPGPLAVVAFQRCQRRDPEQVPQALRGDREQGLVHVGPGRGHIPAQAGCLVGLLLLRLAPVHRLLVEPGRGGDIRLDPDDGGQARRGDGFLEFVGAEHVPVVGHCDRRHAQLGGPDGELADLRGAVQHGVLGVNVQVHERITHEPSPDSQPAGSYPNPRAAAGQCNRPACRNPAGQRGKPARRHPGGMRLCARHGAGGCHAGAAGSPARPGRRSGPGCPQR